jgi:hypothetical protein
MGRAAADSVLEFLQPAVTVSESGRAAILRIQRKGSRAEAVTVDYQTSDGTAKAGLDYLQTTGRLRFAPGVAALTIRIDLLPDTTHETEEMFLATLSNARGPGVRLATQSNAVVAIQDNDPLPVIEFGAASYSVAEGAAAANISLRRTGPLTDAVSVAFATFDDTATAPEDYTSSQVTVSFETGVRSQTVMVPIHGDSAPDPDESLRLELSNPQGALLGRRSGAVLSIRDDDQALQFTTWAYEGRERAGRAAIAVRRTGGTSGTLTVDYATADGNANEHADYTPVSGQLVFGPGVVTRQFMVPILNDALTEGNEFLSVNLLNPNPPTALGFISQASLTILDDEPTVQFSALRYYVFEPVGGGRQAVITVVRRGPLGGTVHADYATSEATAVAGRDYLDVAGRLTFGPGVASRTFTVPIFGNDTVEPDRIVNLTLFSVDTGLGDPNDANLYIKNNDTAGKAQFDSRVYIGQPLGLVQITITRTGGAAGPASVSYATHDGTALADTHFIAAEGEVTFGPGETVKSFTVALMGSGLGLSPKYFTVTLGETTGGLQLGSKVESLVWIVQ